MELFGEIDAAKFHACMTLFAHAVGSIDVADDADHVFARALNEYFGGVAEARTVRHLRLVGEDVMLSWQPAVRPVTVRAPSSPRRAMELVSPAPSNGDVAEAELTVAADLGNVPRTAAARRVLFEHAHRGFLADVNQCVYPEILYIECACGARFTTTDDREAEHWQALHVREARPHDWRLSEGT